MGCSRIGIAAFGQLRRRPHDSASGFSASYIHAASTPCARASLSSCGFGSGGTRLKRVCHLTRAVGFSVSIVDALSDHGAFWHDGVVDDLGLGDATAINGSDQVILNGKIWEHGAITDIGGTALALNDSGEAIGEITDTQGDVSNFTWTPQGGMQPINSQIAPVAINSQGDLAGDGPGRQAWIFSKTAGDIDLGDIAGRPYGHRSGHQFSGSRCRRERG